MRETSEGIGAEQSIYTRRFSSKEDSLRLITWQVLCREFLQRFISANDVVLDIGAGDGLFSRHITARKKIAVDLSPHVLELVKVGVEVHVAPATQFADLISEKADVAIMSNFLEHLPNKKVLLDVLEHCREALKPGGKLLILQPNIRYAGVAYWDYIDHHIALTEHSLAEALTVSGFRVETVYPKFLPYTAKSSLLQMLPESVNRKVVRWYLRLPLLWKLFGKQTFVVARA